MIATDGVAERVGTERRIVGRAGDERKRVIADREIAGAGAGKRGKRAGTNREAGRIRAVSGIGKDVDVAKLQRRVGLARLRLPFVTFTLPVAPGVSEILPEPCEESASAALALPVVVMLNGVVGERPGVSER